MEHLKTKQVSIRVKYNLSESFRKEYLLEYATLPHKEQVFEINFSDICPELRKTIIEKYGVAEVYTIPFQSKEPLYCESLIDYNTVEKVLDYYIHTKA